ncbi:hypothetical protein STENM223S_07698 [Streptomyces tendae]
MTLGSRPAGSRPPLAQVPVAFARWSRGGHHQYVEVAEFLTARGNRVFLMQLVPLVVTSALAYSLAQAVAEIEAVAQREDATWTLR